MRRLLFAMLIPAALAAGCKEEPKKAARPDFDLSSHARQVAEQNLASGTGGPVAVEVRGVQVYAQAMPRQIAVCGQVRRGRSSAFTFFVSVVSYEDMSDNTPPGYHLEQYVADTIDGATRVWIEMIGHCYEQGGPQPGQRPNIQTLPPMPNPPLSQAPAPAGATSEAAPPEPPVPQPGRDGEARDASAPREPAPVRDAPAVRTAASGTVVLRQNGNLHAEPRGGDVIRVVPRNTVLRVFGEAPGGWYQVGDAEPWGWVHRSMVDVQQ